MRQLHIRKNIFLNSIFAKTANAARLWWRVNVNHIMQETPTNATQHEIHTLIWLNHSLCAYICFRSALCRKNATINSREYVSRQMHTHVTQRRRLVRIMAKFVIVGCCVENVATEFCSRINRRQRWCILHTSARVARQFHITCTQSTSEPSFKCKFMQSFFNPHRLSFSGFQLICYNLRLFCSFKHSNKWRHKLGNAWNI